MMKQKQEKDRQPFTPEQNSVFYKLNPEQREKTKKFVYNKDIIFEAQNKKDTKKKDAKRHI